MVKAPSWPSFPPSPFRPARRFPSVPPAVSLPSRPPFPFRPARRFPSVPPAVSLPSFPPSPFRPARRFPSVPPAVSLPSFSPFPFRPSRCFPSVLPAVSLPVIPASFKRESIFSRKREKTPEARSSVYRDGRETAVSMSRHDLFRMIAANVKALRSYGIDGMVRPIACGTSGSRTCRRNRRIRSDV